ncbi:MAG: prepilin-type N-terminal cleavage/methylation domain-containing protein [Leptolyngbyaceae cyanobacterium RU_5_1]|nr:prepilin-type N-terminal cleavage/methylation domain-containing protein [Leptolyngbyaceae cyanobacterium RU_5_1]
MAKTLLTNRLKPLRGIFKRRRNAGFTLTELLVSMIIGALMTVMLLSLVVDLTKTNQEDAARSQVQLDMQAALDYVAQDLREAVFVYNGECLAGNGIPTATDFDKQCPGIVNYIPEEMNRDGRTSVLAFWRAEPLPKKIRDICGKNATNLTNLVEAQVVPCISGATYSLVVYAIDTTNVSNLWKGNARLVRYKLSQFPDDPADEQDQNQGYVNPLRSADLTFQQWPLQLSKGEVSDRQNTEAYKPGKPNNQPFVLVDFVDDRGAVVEDKDGKPVPVTPSCEEFGTDPPSQANALSPKNTKVRGFYACVRNGGLGSANQEGANQDVLLTLVGNVTGQSGFAKEYDNKNRLSPLQTRVLVRGAVRKS